MRQFQSKAQNYEGKLTNNNIISSNIRLHVVLFLPMTGHYQTFHFFLIDLPNKSPQKASQ